MCPQEKEHHAMALYILYFSYNFVNLHSELTNNKRTCGAARGKQVVWEVHFVWRRIYVAKQLSLLGILETQWLEYPTSVTKW